jgi:hypothetical protein
VQHFGDGGFNALVGIGNHQLDAAQTTSSELAQELSPEGLGLKRSAQPADLLLEVPVMPIALTKSSTERVEMPCT